MRVPVSYVEVIYVSPGGREAHGRTLRNQVRVSIGVKDRASGSDVVIRPGDVLCGQLALPRQRNEGISLCAYLPASKTGWTMFASSL